jgi:hypothetical protein
MDRRNTFALALLALCLAACSNGSSDSATPEPANPPDPPDGESPWTYKVCESVGTSSAPPAAAEASPAGLWVGTLTNELLKQTEPYMAIVAPDGQLRLLSTGYTQFAATFEMNANAYSATGFAESGGTPWNDGTLLGELTMGGQIAEQDSLQGEWLLSSGDAGCFDFAYDAGAYEFPSSLELLEGTWIMLDGWGWEEFMRWTIQPDGRFASVDYYGCGYSGTFSLIDTSRNLYAAEIRIEPIDAESHCVSPGNFSALAWIELGATSSSSDHSLALSLVSEGDTWRLSFDR